MMYQDNYTRQEVYCDAKAGESDYSTYVDPNMLLATCSQSYALENEESQWYSSTLSSPVDVQMQYIENMPLPPSPTETMTFSPYSETLSLQPSPIEGTFDYYPLPMHDIVPPYDYYYDSQLSPSMEDQHHRQHQHQHQHIHHYSHDGGVMCSPQHHPTYSLISSRHEQQQDHTSVFDNTTPTTPGSLEATNSIPTPTVATNATTTVAADNNSSTSTNTINTHIRPYPCYLCPRSFARKHDLQRHIRVHTGAKPYACLCCKKAFARTDALKRHLRMEEICRKSPEIQAMKCAGKRRYRNL